MDISKNLNEMKDFSMKFSEVRYAHGRARAHYEMLQALNLYVMTHLEDEKQIEAFKKFEEIIFQDLSNEIDNFENLSQEYDEHKDKLDMIFRNKGEDE